MFFKCALTQKKRKSYKHAVRPKILNAAAVCQMAQKQSNAYAAESWDHVVTHSLNKHCVAQSNVPHRTCGSFSHFPALHETTGLKSLNLSDQKKWDIGLSTEFYFSILLSLVYSKQWIYLAPSWAEVICSGTI